MIDVQIDPRSQRLLEDALNKATKTMHPAKAVNKAGWQICRSAGAGMKMKKTTRREIIDNPQRQQKANRRKGRGFAVAGAKYLIKVLHQDGPPTYIPTNKKTDRRRRIQRINLAHSTWKISQGKFGTSARGAKVRGASKFQRVIQRWAEGKYTAKIENRLSYMLEAFPGVVDRAIVKGMTAFVAQFDRDWARAIKAGRY